MTAFIILSACSSKSPDTTSFIASQDTLLSSTTTSESPAITVPITTQLVETDSVITTEKPTVQVITPEKAKEMMDQENVIIVDVRRADEYAQGHIEGAILVPNETISEEAATALPDKNAVYLIYCRSGRRSKEAAHKLIALGYTNVYDFGGILSWEYGTVQ
ncbi:MAG: rhodanese-like domain-containing protein [Clostridia bacterium]|nr:rhodanese-like domain-containing protein [Clostridia bacterium]